VHARLVVCERTFPTGMLGHHVRRLADAGLVAVLTATSPARLGHPSGGPKLAGTNPLAIGIPSSGGDPIVVDASMGAVTWGDVVAGLAEEEQLVPFGGEHAHKSFALALGLQLLVDTLVREEGYAAVLLVAQPEADPVPALRERAAGVRLPGDS
jgi:Malate/L-lactate dehydrogenase